MGLKLIYSAKEVQENAPVPSPAESKGLVWKAILLFLAVKIPMLFVTNNPEELRDFDHYLRMASGQIAFKDFVWLYGPLAPLLYGTLMKIFPEVLLTARILTLGLWTGGVYFIARLLQRYQFTGFSYWFGILFVTGLTAYPSYSHNHIVATVAMLGILFTLSRYRELRNERDLHFSYAALLVIFFCRPILSGYGAMALWGFLFLSDPLIKNRLRYSLYYFSAFTVVFGIFRLIYGPGLWSAFYPQPWAILETKSYPNLHYLVVHLSSFDKAGVVLALKQLRAAMETGMFYLHYFIWPTVVFTLATLIKGRWDIKTAALAAGFSLVSSLDLLHYGFSDPMSEQAMWVRGQYFMSGTALSLLLVLWPTLKLATTRRKRWAAGAVLGGVFLWSYMPYGVGVTHLVQYPRNQFSLPAMRGITSHADRTAIFEAVQFVNSKSKKSDYVVFPQYEPGVARLLTGQDLFELDSYIFTRMPWYQLKRNETPYAPNGKITNGEVIQSRLEAMKPRFFVIQGTSTYSSSYCSQAGWQSKAFGPPGLGRTVCWHE